MSIVHTVQWDIHLLFPDNCIKSLCQRIVYSNFKMISNSMISEGNKGTLSLRVWQRNHSTQPFILCLFKLSLKESGVLKKATSSESSLTRLRLGASLNTTGNIKPQPHDGVIAGTQWGVYLHMFFQQSLLNDHHRHWSPKHSLFLFSFSVVLFKMPHIDWQTKRKGERKKPWEMASLVHNLLEKMKAITLMLLTLEREEWGVIALRLLVLLCLPE